MKEDILEFRAIRNQQDKEYEETLRADKAKVHNNKNVICIIVLICLNACFIIYTGRRKEANHGTFSEFSVRPLPLMWDVWMYSSVPGNLVHFIGSVSSV